MERKKTRTDHQPLEDLQRFERALLTEKGASFHTCAAYLSDIRQFLEHLNKKNLKWSDWNEALSLLRIRSFITSLFSSHRPASIHRKLSALRALSDFLSREGKLDANTGNLVSGPKQESTLPRFLTPEEARRLMAARPGKDPLSLRDTAILELLYSSGLRVSECASLRCSDVDLKERWVRLLGKGNKQRIVPIGSRAQKALEAYSQARRSLLSGKPGTGGDPGVLFLNHQGKPLSTRSIGRMIHVTAREAGLSGRVSPHALRHSFATHLLSHGADLRAIQEMLGHSSLSTTQKYTHLDIEGLLREYDQVREKMSGDHPLGLAKKGRV